MKNKTAIEETMSMEAVAAEPSAAYLASWIAQQFKENPNQVFDLDPDNPDELLVRPERNARGFTPEVGDKSLTDLMGKLITEGQSVPSLATLNADGVADLYAGFRRARSIQTHNADPGAELKTLRVLITTRIMTEEEVFLQSLSENVDRQDMTVMQRVAALLRLTSEPMSMSLSAAGKVMNMSKGAASTYLRFDQFPDVLKKALDAGTISYKGAERYVSLLPKREQLQAAEDGGAALLKKAQDRIAASVTGLLAKGKKVKAGDTDAATRKLADSGGKVANKTQRRSTLVIKEIDEMIAAVGEDASKASQKLAATLAAFKKFVNGGSMKALVKVLEN